jgi:hypothetical protein
MSLITGLSIFALSVASVITTLRITSLETKVHKLESELRTRGSYYQLPAEWEDE